MATATLSDTLNLAAWNALVNAGSAAQPGSVKVVWGTYTGAGASGSANPNTLTFDGQPIYVEVRPAYNIDNAEKYLVTRLGSPYLEIKFDNYKPNSTSVTWGTNSVSWYVNAQENPQTLQMNISSRRYLYLALVGF